MRIKFIKRDKKEKYSDYDVFLDGIKLPDTEVTPIAAFTGEFSISCESPSFDSPLISLSISEFEKAELLEIRFYKREVKLEKIWYSAIFSICLADSKSFKGNNPFQHIFASYGKALNLSKWSYPFSFLEFKSEFERVCIVHGNSALIDKRSDSRITDSNDITIAIKVEDNAETPQKYLETLSNIYDQVWDICISNLSQPVIQETVSTLFNFPEEIKSSCLQYLMYFGQFLKDMGIEAQLSINEEISGTLFKVHPTNSTEGLEAIRNALDIYINAPSRPDLESQSVLSTQKDIAVIQWEANIHHLKGQLAIAGAILQAKDFSIEALQLSNYELKQKLANTPNVNEGKPKEEQIIDGVIAVKKYEGKGFSIDFAELYRRLKRRFQ